MTSYARFSCCRKDYWVNEKLTNGRRQTYSPHLAASRAINSGATITLAEGGSGASCVRPRLYADNLARFVAPSGMGTKPWHRLLYADNSTPPPRSTRRHWRGANTFGLALAVPRAAPRSHDHPGSTVVGEQLTCRISRSGGPSAMQPLPVLRTDLPSVRAAETVVESAGWSPRFRDGRRSSQKTGASYANSGGKSGRSPARHQDFRTQLIPVFIRCFRAPCGNVLRTLRK